LVERFFTDILEIDIMILNWRLVVIWQAVFALFSISASASGSDLFERPPFETITIPRHEENSLREEEVMMAWHPDGKTLAIVQEENIEAWDMIKGKFIKRITVKKGETQTLKLGARFLENGKTLVVGGYRVDMNSSRSINLFNSKYVDQDVRGIAYSSMCDAISYENKKDNKVYIATCVHRAEESKINPWKVNLKYPVKIWAVTQDGGKVLISGDEEVSWYNLKSDMSEGQLKLDKHKSNITRHSTNPNSTILATGDYDGLICIWDLRSMKLLNVLRAHLDSVKDIAFSADGKTLYGVSGNSLTVWDVESGKKKAAISVGGAAIAPSPDGKLIAVVTNSNPGSGIVELVDWASSRKKGQVGLAYRDYQGKEKTEISIKQLGWYSCPNPIIGVSSNGYYRMNQDDSVVEAKKFAIGSFGGYYSVLNSHSPRICYANEEQCAVFDLINSETEKIWGFDESLKKEKGFNNKMFPFHQGLPAWIGNGDIFVCSVYGSTTGKSEGARRYFGLCNVKTGECSLTPLDEILGTKPPYSWTAMIAVSKDAKTAALLNKRVVEILDIAGKKLLHRFDIGKEQERDSYNPLFSPDGRLFFVRVRGYSSAGGFVESVKAWDLRSGESVELPDMKFEAHGIAMSPDGSRLAVRTQNHVTLWAINEGAVKEERVIKIGFSREINTPLVFSPDGSQLAAFESGGIRLWSVHKDEK
jgi:WD40 repeat protein